MPVNTERLMATAYDYGPFSMLGVGSLKLAEVLNWIPAPETAFKAALMAFISGLFAALAKWAVESFKSWLRKRKSNDGKR